MICSDSTNIHSGYTITSTCNDCTTDSTIIASSYETISRYNRIDYGCTKKAAIPRYNRIDYGCTKKAAIPIKLSKSEVNTRVSVVINKPQSPIINKRKINRNIYQRNR
jgi:hypothetical protein